MNQLLEERIGTEVSIRNILFATDFSNVSEAAVPYARALALRYGSTLHVAHVLPEVTFLRPGAPDPAVIGSIYEDAHSGAQEKMQRLTDRLQGFPHRAYVRHGKVCDMLAEIIREQKIDLLVAGTHGRTGLGKLVMGSVAEDIFRHASCPVLTVGPRVAAAERVADARHDPELPLPQVKFRQILYATDFKPDSAQGVSYAVSLANEFRAKLTLLHVIEDFGEKLHEHPGPIEIALRKLQALVPDDSGLRYPLDLVAEFGIPSEQILLAAAGRDADLILLGVRPAASHMAAATHLGGSTAHKVVVGANCPVLTIRGKNS